MPTSHMSFTQKAWRLSPMYFFYFALFGCFVPFIARFLTEHGLTPAQASIVVAVLTGMNMFAPFLFSFLADKTGRRLIYIRIGYTAIGCLYLMALMAEGFWYYLGVFACFGIFLSAVLPQMESLTLSVLQKERGRYGQIRLWGSIGFVGIVWLMGYLLDHFSVDIIVYFGVTFSVLMLAATWLIPERPKATVTEKPAEPVVASTEKTPLPWAQISVLLVVVFLWQFSMAPYNTFFDLYMREQGYAAATNGFLISFGSFCEIAIFIYVATLFKYFSERSLICVGLLFTVARWLMLAFFAETLWLVVIAQSFHAMTFGVVHSVVIHRLGRLFPAHRASFGQGLYVALGMGLGLFSGNIFSGIIWNGSGVIYVNAALWAVLALVIAWFGFSDKNLPEAK